MTNSNTDLQTDQAQPAYGRRAEDIVELKVRVKMLEDWKTTTETSLKEIRDVISQVKLLMSLSIGGGGLSLLSLIILIFELVTRGGSK